jgi:hypothetical protein
LKGQGEALAVEGKLVANGAAVVDRHGVLLVFGVAERRAGARRRDMGDRLLARDHDIIERCGHRAGNLIAAVL